MSQCSQGTILAGDNIVIRLTFALLLCAVALPAFSADVKLFHIDCYGGGENPTRTFSRYMKGTIESSASGFQLVGAVIDLFRTSEQNTACRDWYETPANPGTFPPFFTVHRNWNALVVKAQDAETYVTCSPGSVLTVYPSSVTIVHNLTDGYIDDPTRRLHSEGFVSSKDCILDRVNP